LIRDLRQIKEALNQAQYDANNTVTCNLLQIPQYLKLET
jgi:hypothetical protein